jgi:ribosomal protein L7/L12
MNDIKDLPAAALSALQQGSKIEAIKHVREAHHIGLKEAKDVVEQYMDANPQVKQRMAAANAESARGFLGWLVLAAALALAAYYFYAGSR